MRTRAGDQGSEGAAFYPSSSVTLGTIPPARPRRRAARAVAIRTLGAGLIVLLALLAAYLAAGVVIYDRISTVEARCGGRLEGVTPSRPSADRIDPTPYVITDYREVAFASRDQGITIQGWYAPSARGRDAPAVILVHGLGGCRRDPAVLIPAGMLHRAGFAILAIDLRDHGDSTVEDGRYAGGIEEARDVLGARDWLIREQRLGPDRIGLFGISMGAAAVLIAAADEPGIRAVWEDSSYADTTIRIGEELHQRGYPTFFAPAGGVVSRLVSGDDIVSVSPLTAVASLSGRALFVAHGGSDTRTSVHHAEDLTTAARDAGADVHLWVVSGIGHAEAMFTHTKEYESRLIAFFRRYLGPR